MDEAIELRLRHIYDQLVMTELSAIEPGLADHFSEKLFTDSEERDRTLLSIGDKPGQLTNLHSETSFVHTIQKMRKQGLLSSHSMLLGLAENLVDLDNKELESVIKTIKEIVRDLLLVPPEERLKRIEKHLLQYKSKREIQ